MVAERYDKLVDLLNKIPVNLLVWVQIPGPLHDVDRAAKAFFQVIGSVPGPSKCLLLNGFNSLDDEVEEVVKVKERIRQQWVALDQREFRFASNSAHVLVSYHKEDFVQNVLPELFRVARICLPTRQNDSRLLFPCFSSVLTSQRNRFESLAKAKIHEKKSLEEQISLADDEIKKYQCIVKFWDAVDEYTAGKESSLKKHFDESPTAKAILQRIGEHDGLYLYAAWWYALRFVLRLDASQRAQELIRSAAMRRDLRVNDLRILNDSSAASLAFAAAKDWQSFCSLVSIPCWNSEEFDSSEFASFSAYKY